MSYPHFTTSPDGLEAVESCYGDFADVIDYDQERRFRELDADERRIDRHDAILCLQSRIRRAHAEFRHVLLLGRSVGPAYRRVVMEEQRRIVREAIEFLRELQ